MGYESLYVGALTASTGVNAAPASGATITLFEGDANASGQPVGKRWKTIVVWINSSHDSAASGVAFTEKASSSGTYRAAATAQTYLTANGVTRYVFKPMSRFVKITYQNSANTLTTWEAQVLGDTEERSA